MQKLQKFVLWISDSLLNVLWCFRKIILLGMILSYPVLRFFSVWIGLRRFSYSLRVGGNYLIFLFLDENIHFFFFYKGCDLTWL